ncbi:MAG: hypothetical protein LBP90_03340, partial [Burkholderiales bacterium]|nr:hypothetical protein [Burkholderiales bacterium]
MERFLLHALGGVTLILGLLLASLPSAFAGQNIVINTSINHSVAGNGDSSNNGAWPAGGFSHFPASVEGNSVTVNSGGKVDEVDLRVYGGAAYGISGVVTVTGNRVTVNSGGITRDVIGGFASGGVNTTAVGNNVTISGGSAKEVSGGYAISSTMATATDNTVTVSGGTISGDIYGGFAYAGTNTGNETDTGNSAATGNTITISSGTINGHVYGGLAYNDISAPASTSNTIILGGNPTFGTDSALVGGHRVGSRGDVFTGNTLKIHNYTGSAVKRIWNFASYDFLLPVSLEPLKVTERVYFERSGGDAETSRVTNVNLTEGGSAPKVGDKITLIHAVGGF